MAIARGVGMNVDTEDKVQIHRDKALVVRNVPPNGLRNPFGRELRILQPAINPMNILCLRPPLLCSRVNVNQTLDHPIYPVLPKKLHV